MDQLPSISIIIPTLNRARYLKRGLDSILESEYPNLEIIVIDGASSDDTVKLLGAYGSRITKWVSERDKGEYDALNKGIRFSRNEYILHFTDDDVIVPSSLKQIGEFASINKNYEIIFAQLRLWREFDGLPVQYGVTNYVDYSALDPKKYFRHSPGPPTQGAFVNRRLYERIGLYSTDYIIGDYEFWARAITAGVRCALLPIIIADYHFTGDNGVITKAPQIRRDYVRIVSFYGTTTDKVYVLFRNLINWTTEKLAKASHFVGFHPLRWWVSLNSKGGFRNHGD